MPGKSIQLPEEMLQALGIYPHNMTRLVILTTLSNIETGDLKTVCFFANCLSTHHLSLEEVADGLFWLQSHSYALTQPHVQHGILLAPTEKLVYSLSPSGQALHATLVTSAFAGNFSQIPIFERVRYWLWRSIQVLWELAILALILFILDLALRAFH